MCQIAINIPNEVLYDTRMNLEETSQFVRCAVALGYYTQSGVSIGYCAQIAGLSKEEFIKYLGLSVTGTLGILLKAKKLGILKKLHPLLLHPLLLEMKQNGFYIDSALEAIVLEQAGEQ